MPYHIAGGFVIGPDGQQKNKKPMAPDRLKRYLAALYANDPAVRHKEYFQADSQGHTVRRGKRKPPAGLHSFVQPPEIQTKAITDTLLGKHPEPHGPLRLRSMHGRYLGLVGKRRKLLRRIKSYNASQQRDDHGRWAAVGSALSKLGKIRLRPKVQAVGSVASGLVGAAHTVAHFGHQKPHLPSLTELIYRTEQHTGRLAAAHRARRLGLKAYNPMQPRDWRGRWVTGGDLSLSGPSSKPGVMYHGTSVKAADNILMEGIRQAKASPAHHGTIWATFSFDEAKRYGHLRAGAAKLLRYAIVTFKPRIEGFIHYGKATFDRDITPGEIESVEVYQYVSGGYSMDHSQDIPLLQLKELGDQLHLPVLISEDGTSYQLLPEPTDTGLKTYNPGEPRDWHGRWTSGGSTQASMALEQYGVIGREVGTFNPDGGGFPVYEIVKIAQAVFWDKDNQIVFHEPSNKLYVSNSHEPSIAVLSRKYGKTFTKGLRDVIRTAAERGRIPYKLNGPDEKIYSLLHFYPDGKPAAFLVKAALAYVKAGLPDLTKVVVWNYSKRVYGEIDTEEPIVSLTTLADLIKHGYLGSKEVHLKAYNPAEPRDWHGRWTLSGGLGGLFKGRHNQIKRTANELQGYRRRLPKTDLVIRSHLTLAGGQAASGLYDPSTHRVYVATSGPRPHLDTVHEFGHVLDHRGLGARWVSDSAEGRAWKAAVEKTPEVRQWRKWQKQGYIEHNGNRYKVKPELFRYYLSNHELWARSFAQWHASRSRLRPLRSELHALQRTSVLQWSNRNFGGVDHEITRLMKKNGYLK